MNIKLFNNSNLDKLGFKQLKFYDLYKMQNNTNQNIIDTLFGASLDVKDIYEYERFKALISSYNLDFNSFYYEELLGEYIRIFYIYNGFISQIYQGMNILDSFSNLFDMQNEFNDYFKEKKELSPFLFAKSSNIYAHENINFLSKYMKEKDLIKEVKRLQKQGDYNANLIDKKLIKLAYKDSINLIDDYIDKDGLVSLYRGCGSKSFNIYNAYSWTLNEDVAKFFATRAFYTEKESDMIVYKIRLPKEYIIGVVLDEEQEVLIDTKCFENIKFNKVDFDKSKEYAMPKIEMLKKYEDILENDEDILENNEEDELDFIIHKDLLKLIK